MPYLSSAVSNRRRTSGLISAWAPYRSIPLSPALSPALAARLPPSILELTWFKKDSNCSKNSRKMWAGGGEGGEIFYRNNKRQRHRERERESSFARTRGWEDEGGRVAPSLWARRLATGASTLAAVDVVAAASAPRYISTTASSSSSSRVVAWTISTRRGVGSKFCGGGSRPSVRELAELFSPRPCSIMQASIRPSSSADYDPPVFKSWACKLLTWVYAETARVGTIHITTLEKQSTWVNSYQVPIAYTMRLRWFIEILTFTRLPR